MIKEGVTKEYTQRHNNSHANFLFSEALMFTRTRILSEVVNHKDHGPLCITEVSAKSPRKALAMETHVGEKHGFVMCLCTLEYPLNN